MPPKKVAASKSTKTQKSQPVVSAAQKKSDAAALEALKSAVDRFYDDACEGDPSIASYVITSTLDGWDKFVSTKAFGGEYIDTFDPIMMGFYEFKPAPALKAKDNVDIDKKSFLNIIVSRAKKLTSQKSYHNDYDPDYAVSKDLVPPAHAYKVMTAWVNGMIKKAMKLAADSKKASKNIPTEKASALMGKWAWPQERKSKNMPFEKSTKIENKLLSAIEGHFGGQNSITDDVAQKLMDILEKGMYSDVIHPPAQNLLYRGLVVDITWLARILGYKTLKSMPQSGIVKKNFTFKPKTGSATSWSHSKSVARGFAGDLEKNYYERYNRAGIMMFARPDDNPNKFVAGPDGLYKLDEPSEYTHEKETVGLGPIKVFQIQYVRFDKIFKHK